LAFWLLLSIFLLVDLQWGKRELYLSVISYDYTTRVSIIDAITRTGVPPVNPSYYPGHYVKLTFVYYFWYILGSMIDYMGGPFVNARTALFASVIWCGIALMSLIAFYLRLRDGRDQGGIWRRACIGIFSLSISGLDIIPAIALMYFGGGAIGDLEHWNEIISAWIGSLLWVPHHVAGLIAGTVGVLLVHSVSAKPLKKQLIALAFSGVAFASAIGLSVWVTVVFVLFWGVWMFYIYFQKGQRIIFFLMFMTGIIALFLAAPFLSGLLSGGASRGAFPVVLDVRSFRITDALFINSSISMKSLIRLIFLPLNYFMELGFFFLVAFLWIKNNKSTLGKSPFYVAEVLLLSTSFLVGTFLRSTLIENNDLGWRSWLPGQFILLVWGVDVLDGFFNSRRFFLSQRTKYNLILLVTLGVSTSVLDATLLRFAYFFVFGSEGGRQIYSARQAYDLINETLPKDIIVQYNPMIAVNHPSGLYGMRQSAISDRTAYGVPPVEYDAMVKGVSKIFTMVKVQNWAPIESICKEYAIDVIVVTNTDPLWESLDLLEEERLALYQDDYNAVFFCRGAETKP
jgi:hypothetical protein